MEYLQPQLNGVFGTLLDILTDFLKKQKSKSGTQWKSLLEARCCCNGS